MKNIIIRIVIVLIGISLFRTVQTGDPTIYTEIKHDKSALLDSINRLQNAKRLERIIAGSDSIIAKFIKLVSNKISQINYDYYYVIDYCIDHYQKDIVLSSMTLKEWYEFKQNKSSWHILAGSCSPLGTESGLYTSNDYRVEELNRIKEEVLKEK